MPAIIWAFLTVMWFGFGWEAPISTIVLTSVPFVAINVAKGAAGVSRDLRDMSQAYGVSLGRRTRHLVLPAIAPYLVTGLRFGVILGWQAVLLAEWFGATEGVGFRARYWYDGNVFDGFTAWVILFLAFILILDRWIMEPVARRTFAWRDT
jgi:ABC-type nitrate/sulfonate/bicarbonate transport system permease component